jgi:hypothetical protein
MDKTLGQIAYEAFMEKVSPGYCTNCGDWFGVNEMYREGWEEAARAAVISVCRNPTFYCHGESLKIKKKFEIDLDFIKKFEGEQK